MTCLHEECARIGTYGKRYIPLLTCRAGTGSDAKLRADIAIRTNGLSGLELVSWREVWENGGQGLGTPPVPLEVKPISI